MDDGAPANDSTRGKLAAAVGWLALAFAVGVPLIGGAATPDFSHAGNYISELGQSGAPHAGLVNWAGFFPTGLLVLALLWLVRDLTPIPRTPLVMISSVGLAYIVSAVFPCDPGCPERGSLSQSIHNLTALIGYPATAVGLLQASRHLAGDPAWRALAWFTTLCSVLVAVGFALMLAPSLTMWRGGVQYVAEAPAFVWFAVIGMRAGQRK